MFRSRSLARKLCVARKTSPRWSVLPMSCLPILLACGGSTEPKRDLLLEGTVTSAATGAAISGATVGVFDGSGLGLAPVQSSTTTDAQGHYIVSHLGCIKNPYLHASAAGYFLNSEKLACRSGTQTVSIALTPSP